MNSSSIALQTEEEESAAERGSDKCDALPEAGPKAQNVPIRLLAATSGVGQAILRSTWKACHAR